MVVYSVNVLLGKMIAEVRGMERGSSESVLVFDDGSRLRHWHARECCESVTIEDVSGDVADLVGSRLLMCEVVSNSDNELPVPPDADSSHTWTFVKFATVKGYVTVRWFGSSNGYYSEQPQQSVELAQ